MTMRFERFEHAQSVVMDGEWIIVNTSNGVVTQLNEVGGWVWSCLERGEDVEGLADRIQARYNVSRQAAIQDLQAFLERLIQIGLVKNPA
jgi:hypothetical protein